MKIALLLPFILFSMQISRGQNVISIKAGSSNVNLEFIDYKNDSLLFINLHNDEETSIKATKEILPLAFGKYIGILSGGKREVSFSNNGKTVTFDPNRIYTNTGIAKTLNNYNCYSDSNLKIVKVFSTELLKYFTNAKLLVAVHNNTDAGYSISSLLKDMKTKKDAKEIYVNPEKDEDDFYYVTEKSKFDYFKSRGYNVVLQDNKHVEDDGSLSVYCGKHHIDYINIECQYNHMDQQIQMIKEIYKGFFNYSF